MIYAEKKITISSIFGSKMSYDYCGLPELLLLFIIVKYLMHVPVPLFMKISAKNHHTHIYLCGLPKSLDLSECIMPCLNECK